MLGPILVVLCTAPLWSNIYLSVVGVAFAIEALACALLSAGLFVGWGVYHATDAAVCFRIACIMCLCFGSSFTAAHINDDAWARWFSLAGFHLNTFIASIWTWTAPKRSPDLPAAVDP